MSREAPPVPEPFNKHAKRTNELFTLFYKEVGKWPWEVVSFGPKKWGQNLVQDFMRLLSVDLPNTEGVDVEGLIEYMYDESAHHPMPSYRYQLSLMVIAKATKWLADKRELISPPQQHDPDPDSDSDSDSDSSILNEPANVTRNRAQAQAQALRAVTRRQPTQRSAPRSARKRPINYSEKDYFRSLRNIDDAEEEDEEEQEEEVETVVAVEPPAKKRLMVFFNFSPQHTDALSKAMGDSLTVPGETQHSRGRHSTPQRNALVGESRFLGAQDESLNDAQRAYADYLKSEIVKLNEDINRSQANINNSTRRYEGYQEIARISEGAIEEATRETTKASQAVQLAKAGCSAESATMEEIRKIGDDNPGFFTPEMLKSIEEGTAAQRAKKEAEVELGKKVKRLNELKNKIEMAKSKADPLQSKINELSEVLRAQEKRRDSLKALHRLIAMGEKMEQVLGEKGLEGWVKEQSEKR
ncbi:hypothetical protein IL306_000377 [Fusarium sp. DS 682]|nr:hypothetical protein IL306_000377 [Fusarium sp. DS 682]